MGSAQHRRNHNRHKARGGGESTYDGVTDGTIYRRDEWQCRMPECLCPDGREIAHTRSGQLSANRPGMSADPWRGSIDHILPLASGGRDDAPNKRAAHALCNEAAQEHYKRRKTGLSHTIREAPGAAAILAALVP